MNTHASTTVVVRSLEAAEFELVRREFSALAVEPAGVTLVAWADDEPVGHIQICWDGSVHSHVRAQLHGTPEVRRLRVHDNAQRRGVAKVLLEAVEVLAFENDHRTIGLAVGITNTAAIALYERCGWTVADIAPFDSPMGMNENGERHHHVVQYMTKTLAEQAIADIRDRALVIA